MDLITGLQLNPHDHETWGKWFKMAYPRVYFILYQRTAGDIAVSKDCAQGAMERFFRYKAYEKVDNDSDSVAYLARIALRLLADYKAKENSMVESLDDTGNVTATASKRAAETNLEVDRLASHLSNTDRELLELLIDGYTLHEIAKKLGIGYSACGVRVHRLKERIKTFLNPM